MHTHSLEKIMKIARFEPWPYVDLLQRDLNQRPARKATAEWVPAVDIIEEKDRFQLHADVPGVKREDLEISLEKGVLTVSGVRNGEVLGENSDLRRTERLTGRFSRRFTLPETTDADRVTAKISNGILEVVIPKLPVVQPRQITVEAA
jgi:HSP20 family protein